MTIQEKIARALYASAKFVRPWDHPKTIAVGWHKIYRGYARTALREIAKIKRQRRARK